MKRIIVLILMFCIGVARVYSSVSLITRSITFYPEKETGKIARIMFNTDTRGGVLFLIKDEKGKIIKSLSTGKIEPGQHYVDWDGKDYEGNIVPEGKYNVSIITGISMKIDEKFGHSGRIGLETIEMQVSDPEKITCRVSGEIKKVFLNNDECYKVDSFAVAGPNYTFKDGIIQINPASGAKKGDIVRIEYYYPFFLENPWDIDTDANGNLYVILRWKTQSMKYPASNLLKISSDGNKLMDDFGVKGKIGPFAGKENLQLIVNDNENRIYIGGAMGGHGTGVFSLKTGAFLYQIGGWFVDGLNPKTTYYPAGICLGPENKIYIRGVSAYDRTKEKDSGFLYKVPPLKRHAGYPPLIYNYFGPSMESGFPLDNFYLTTHTSEICKIKDNGKEFVELYYLTVDGNPVGISYDQNTGLIFAALRTLKGEIAVIHDTGTSLNELYRLNDKDLGPIHTVKLKGNQMFVVEDGISPYGIILDVMKKKNVDPLGENRISKYLIGFETLKETCSITVSK